MTLSKISSWTATGQGHEKVSDLLAQAVRQAEQLLDAATPNGSLELATLRVDYTYDPRDRDPAQTLARLIAASARMAAVYPVGGRVLIPRSGGKPPSEGQVLGHRADGKVRVTFQTADGQAATKDLAPDALDALNQGAPPPPAIPGIEVLYPLGSKLRIPRADGSTSEGVVVGYANGQVQVSFAVGSQVGSKNVPPESLHAVNPALLIKYQTPPGFERVQGGQRLVQDLILPSNSSGPAVQIDYHHPQVKQIVAHAQMLARRDCSPAERVMAMQSRTRQSLGGTPEDLNALEASKGEARAVSLGDYINAGVGLCKQNSLALQVGLQALGVESSYVRGFVAMPDGKLYGHAWVEATIRGRLYVLDNLWKDWNFKLASEVYRENWRSPRGIRLVKQDSQQAVAYRPVTPRALPAVEAQEAYPIGRDVLVPRTSGPPTPGKVTAHVGSDKVRVDFAGAHKVLERSALDRVNPLDLSLSDQLPPELAG